MSTAAHNIIRTDLAHVYRTAMERSQMRARAMDPEAVETTRIVITDDVQDAAIVSQHILTGAALIAHESGGFRIATTDAGGNTVTEELSGVDALSLGGLKDQFRLSFYNLPGTSAQVGSYRSVLTELIHRALVEYVLWQWFRDLGMEHSSFEQGFRETVSQIRSHSFTSKIFTRKPSAI